MRWQASLTEAARDRLRALGLLARAEALEPPPWLAPGDLVALETGGRACHLRVARRVLVVGEDGAMRGEVVLDVGAGG